MHWPGPDGRPDGTGLDTDTFDVFTYAPCRFAVSQVALASSGLNTKPSNLVFPSICVLPSPGQRVYTTSIDRQ